MSEAAVLCSTVREKFTVAFGEPNHRIGNRLLWSLKPHPGANAINILLSCAEPVTVWVFDPHDAVNGIYYRSIKTGADQEAVIATIKVRLRRTGRGQDA